MNATDAESRLATRRAGYSMIRIARAHRHLDNPTMQPSLQVSLIVADRRCVVIGGDAVAEERVVRLLEAHARVAVVTRTLTEPLARWAGEGRIEHHARSYEPTDLDGAFLVLTCEPDQATAARVFADASARGVLAYAQDRPESSHLAMPALVRRGHLRLAISTSAASPALAGRLRVELERIFDQTFVRYTHWLAELRDRLRDEEPDPERRATALRAAVEGFHLNVVIHYPEGFRHAEVTKPR
jgi:siroheme synthase-like protein